MSSHRIVRLAVTGLAIVASTSACSKADSAAEAKEAPASATVAATSNVGAPLLTPSGDSLPDSALVALADRGRLMGQEGAPIWVVMISDFQCPYCKTWHDNAMANVQRDYVKSGRVRLAYLNLPLQQHKHARSEAEAALCAGVQGKFWEYSEGLFARQEQIATLGLVEPLLDSLARAKSLDMDAFARCQKRDAIRALVQSDIQQASKAGVRSTPSFLVGDFLVEGALPYADFRKAIDTALVTARANKGTR